MEDVKISSNWYSEKEADLKNVVTFLQPDNNVCDIDNITPETCVCLSKKECDGLDSKLELDIRLKYPMKEINVFSEGSLIEVFGVHDEYLFTCLPEFLDDWEGLAVYRAKISLPGINSCKLKFTRCKEKDRMWLYSLQLSIIKTEGQQPINNSLFNFENVNKIINNSAHQISEKAEKFKKCFELHSKNSSNAQRFSVQHLLNVINSECNLHLPDRTKGMGDCLTSSKFLSSSDSLTAKKDENRYELSLECQYLRGYIDRKFAELREDLLKTMEMKLGKLRDENNAKLDHIIRLLESSKT